MLFKTEVRRINLDYSAGAERVFLDDAAAFIRRSLLTHAYVAGKLYPISSVVGRKIKRINYPYWVLDGADECIYRSRIKLITDILHSIKEIISFFLELYYAIIFVLSERGADIYYVFDCPLVALLSPKKTLLSFHNFHEGLSYIFRFKKIISQTTMAFPSKSLRDEYVCQYPDINKNACLVVPNAVDISFFKAKRVRQRQITFLFASAWVKEKGIQYIEYCVRELNKKYLDKINFVIGGSVDLWSLSQRRYKELRDITSRMQQLEETYSNVTMVGRVKRHDMPPLYRRATYLLFPSVWQEPCALMVLEAMASGTPVIAFARGGTKEIIRNNENGYLIEKVNKKYLLATLIHIIDTFSAPTYERMSLKCRQSAVDFRASRRMQIITRLPLFQ